MYWPSASRIFSSYFTAILSKLQDPLPWAFTWHSVSFQSRLERNVRDGVTIRATLDGDVGCFGANS